MECVILSVQPAGGVTETGLVARKSSPGTHAYQNVPTPELLVLALLSVIVYLKSEPSATELIVALALIVAIRARPSRVSKWRDRRILGRFSLLLLPDVSAAKTWCKRVPKRDRDILLSSVIP